MLAAPLAILEASPPMLGIICDVSRGDTYGYGYDGGYGHDHHDDHDHYGYYHYYYHYGFRW
ncbi:unnamed protein product, partial [Rotaria sp. Silwood1]